MDTGTDPKPKKKKKRAKSTEKENGLETGMTQMELKNAGNDEDSKRAAASASNETHSAASNLALQRLQAEANRLRTRGNFSEAISAYDRVLEMDATNTEALNQKGSCYKHLNQNQLAMECYQKVLELDPNDWSAHNNRGIIYKETGLLPQAMEEYKRAIDCGPENNVARENMALVLTDYGIRLKVAGNTDSAIKKFEEAIQYHPRCAAAHFNLGVVFSERSIFIQALKHYEDALACQPNSVEALCNIGVIYKNSGQLENAIKYYLKALKINPNFLVANNNIAIAYTDLGTKVKNEGNIKQGVEYYKKALVYNSKYAAAWYNLGVAYAEQGRTDEAIVCYEMAINFNNKCAEAYNNLGVIFKDRGNMEKSIIYYQEALKANPMFAQTLNNLGVIYTMLGKLEEAYAYCERAIQANKDYAEAYNNLGVLYRDEGRIEEAIQSYDHCLRIDPHNRNAGQNRLLAMNSLIGNSMTETEAITKRVYEEHAKWGMNFANGFAAERLAMGVWANKRNLNRPLRVGYLSADFFTHSVSYFIEAPLAHADPKRQYTICYANVVRKDGKTQHLQKFAHTWRSVYGLHAKEVADMVRQDSIDILIELTGHTAGNRLDVMALKPAPIQVTWIGYPNTTGLPTIDYRFTDNIVDPQGTNQKFSEDVVRLPGPFLCYTPPYDAPEVNPVPAAVNNGYVTFGSFNNLAKVNNRVLQAWASILKAVPTSRLLVKCKPFASPTVRSKMLEKFQALGIDSRRIDLVPLLPTTSEHLSTYAMVDISVDTFPYAGTTTTCEALYMGVPVVTLCRTDYPIHAHNVGATLLSRIEGVGSLIAANEKEYVEIAVGLANDIDRLTQIRSNLRIAMLKSPLCDGKTFCKGLEDTFHRLWAKFVENGSESEAKHFSLPASSSSSSSSVSSSSSTAAAPASSVPSSSHASSASASPSSALASSAAAAALLNSTHLHSSSGSPTATVPVTARLAAVHAPPSSSSSSAQANHHPHRSSSSSSSSPTSTSSPPSSSIDDDTPSDAAAADSNHVDTSPDSSSSSPPVSASSASASSSAASASSSRAKKSKGKAGGGASKANNKKETRGSRAAAAAAADESSPTM